MPSRPAVFQVSGDWRDYEAPTLSGSTDNLQVQVLTGFVTFSPRVPPGFLAYMDDFDLSGDGSIHRNTGIAFPPIQARIWEGQLATIDVSDTPGMQLVSNDPGL